MSRLCAALCRTSLLELHHDLDIEPRLRIRGLESVSRVGAVAAIHGVRPVLAKHMRIVAVGPVVEVIVAVLSVELVVAQAAVNAVVSAVLSGADG